MAQGGIHPPGAHTHTHTSHIDTMSLLCLCLLLLLLPPPFFLSGWMCPQVRVIFPLAQIRAELKSEGKVTALLPEISWRTPPPQPYCTEVREHGNLAHKRRCCCASFAKFPLFCFFSFLLCQNSRSQRAAAPVVFSFCLLSCLCRTVTAKMNFGLFKGWGWGGLHCG